MIQYSFISSISDVHFPSWFLSMCGACFNNTATSRFPVFSFFIMDFQNLGCDCCLNLVDMAASFCVPCMCCELKLRAPRVSDGSLKWRQDSCCRLRRTFWKSTFCFIYVYILDGIPTFLVLYISFYEYHVAYRKHQSSNKAQMLSREQWWATAEVRDSSRWQMTSGLVFLIHIQSQYNYRETYAIYHGANGPVALGEKSCNQRWGWHCAGNLFLPLMLIWSVQKWCGSVCHCGCDKSQTDKSIQHGGFLAAAVRASALSLLCVVDCCKTLSVSAQICTPDPSQIRREIIWQHVSANIRVVVKTVTFQTSLESKRAHVTMVTGHNKDSFTLQRKVNLQTQQFTILIDGQQ